jgi:hypothetical protein
MKYDLDGAEVALLISALTGKISKLKLQADLHREQDMPHWADDCDSEIQDCIALKERLFK